MDLAVKASAFATGLRKNIAVAGRRWMSWPGGANQQAAVLAAIDAIGARLRAAADEAAIEACIADLRAVLEWSTYQSASVRTARAVIVARRARTLTEALGLVQTDAPSLSLLADSETALVESVATTNGYMAAIAERHPHLGLPRPLVAAESLVRRGERTPGRLALIQQLTKSAKTPRRR